ncbi:MAG: biopolymer transporter ExbD [Aquisalimonadaceae bacterium]
MRIETGQRRRRQLIGLTPLIDVVFILLIFFMLASSFSNWQSISLGVPGEGRAPAADSETLVVRVLADGSLEVDGDRIDSDALVSRFRVLFAADPQRTVVVRPDDGVTLQRIVTVVEHLNEAGGNRITLSREAR